MDGIGKGKVGFDFDPFRDVHSFELSGYFGVTREEKTVKGKERGYIFRVYAPMADRVYLVADFTDSKIGKEMERVSGAGVYECRLEYSKNIEGANYKFRIVSGNFERYKADPFARRSEIQSMGASVVMTECGFSFSDRAWLEKRKKGAKDKFASSPVNIYEIHLGSWQTKDGRSNLYGDAYLDYGEIASRLVPYVKKMGFTHVGLLPVLASSDEGSAGYTPKAFFSIDERQGEPDSFAFLINKLHEAGIGAVCEFCYSDFSDVESSLAMLDGSPLYEKEEGSRKFDISKNEVRCFIASSLDYFIERYHLDGVKLTGEFTLDNEFMPLLCSFIERKYPDVMIICEDRAKKSKAVSFVIDRTFTEATMEYSSYDPYFRRHIEIEKRDDEDLLKGHIPMLSIMKCDAFSDRGSLIERMYGNYNQKFASARLAIAYHMLSRGKKSMFMGSEFGQIKTWDPMYQLEWFMHDFEMHFKLSEYVRRLNNLYLKCPPLYSADASDKSSLVCKSAGDDGVMVLRRIAKDKSEAFAVFNFSGRPLYSYKLALPVGEYKEIFTSDKESFGGDGLSNRSVINSDGSRAFINIAPLSVCILEKIK